MVNKLLVVVVSNEEICRLEDYQAMAVVIQMIKTVKWVEKWCKLIIINALSPFYLPDVHNPKTTNILGNQ